MQVPEPCPAPTKTRTPQQNGRSRCNLGAQERGAIRTCAVVDFNNT